MGARQIAGREYDFPFSDLFGFICFPSVMRHFVLLLPPHDPHRHAVDKLRGGVNLLHKPNPVARRNGFRIGAFYYARFEVEIRSGYKFFETNNRWRDFLRDAGGVSTIHTTRLGRDAVS